MKLLAISIANHDSNFSYFDGENVHYIKAERLLRVKRAEVSFEDYHDFLYKVWEIKANEMDDVVVEFDPTLLEETKHIKPDEIVKLNKKALNRLGLKTAWFIPHHLSHAHSTWMLEDKPVDFRFVIDGLGDGRPWSVFDKDFNLIDKGDIKNGSIGWLMRDVGLMMGIEANHYNDVASKFMAVQSYGTLDQQYLEKMQHLTINDVNEIFNIEGWIDHKESGLLAKHSILDLIRTIHKKTSLVILDLFKKHAAKDSVVSYSGGVAQNVIINTDLKRYFKNLIIAPHSSDEGLSLGAIEWLRKKHNLPKFKINNFPFSQSDEVPGPLPTLDTIKKTAELLANNKTVAWFQGNGEIGSRALGNRSILFNAANPDAKQLVNKIKNRENYRPFGCSVLEEHYSEYFEGDIDYHMLLVAKPKKYLPAVTHVDNTSRVAAVNEKINYPFYMLLKEFYKLTNCPVLLNTSLNAASRPIAGDVLDVMELFLNSKFLDAIVISNDVIVK